MSKHGIRAYYLARFASSRVVVTSKQDVLLLVRRGHGFKRVAGSRSTVREGLSRRPHPLKLCIDKPTIGVNGIGGLWRGLDWNMGIKGSV